MRHKKIFAVLAFNAIFVIVSCGVKGETNASEQSKTCGVVTGPTEPDVNRGLRFCHEGVAAGVVSGLIADDSIVTIKVTRQAADEMLRDRLSAEQLLKTWMRGWRQVTGKKTVTVKVEWGDVMVAEGYTGMTGGDQVAFR